MLTNNKKNFVRSIAMLLAMLMVLALCLTGCGNKTADEALAKAEEAKTVADDVKAALAGYLTTADAEATVNALVDAALADGAATAEELDALAAKLENYVTTDKVAELIKAEVAAAAIEGAMTKDEIMEILENYYTKDEIDEKLEAYFGDFEPAAVYKMMQDVDKAMNENEWNEASDVVIETIAAMQELIEAIEDDTYTQANMKAVNEKLAPLGVKAFVVDEDDKNGNGSKEDLVKPAVYAVDFGKMLEYTILRVASVEAMEDLKAAVEAAAAVDTYESEIEDLKAELFAMGDLVAYGKYPYAPNANKEKDKYFEAKEWDKVGSYHGLTYAKESEKLAQVVTLNDKADFYAWGKALDALKTTYAWDAYVMGTVSNTVYSVFSKTQLVGTDVQVVIATQLKDEDPTKDVMSGYVKVGETVITDATYLNAIFNANALTDYEETNDAVLALPVAFFDYDDATLADVETNWKNTGKYGYSGNTTVKTDAELTYADKDTQEAEEWKNAYNAIVAQLNECQTAANAANERFDDFQYKTIYATTVDLLNSKQYAYVTDADLLAALTADMCETGGLNSYPVYLTGVTTLMQRSYALNGKTAAGINEYELYLKMLDKSYDLLWTKYQSQAYDWADAILADYISVVTDALNNSNATNYANATGTSMTGTWSSEFVKAFVEGTAMTSTMYKNLEVSFEEDYLELFYKNNGAAWYVDTNKSIGDTKVTYAKYMANPIDTIRVNAEDIKLRLTGAMLDIDLKIGAASKDAAKASGVAVQKAFYDILNEGIANLEEVYDRFLLDDYKKMVYNDTITLSADIVNFYYDASSAASHDTDLRQSTIISAMQEYLLGIDLSKLNGTTDKDKNDAAYAGVVKYNSSNGKVESFTYGDAQSNEALYRVNYYLGTKFNNHVLLNAVKGISVNKFSTSNEKLAAAAMAKIDGYVEDAKAVIENVVIKTNFEEYLEAARTNWLKLRLDYTAEVNAFNTANANLYITMLYDMQLLNTEIEDTITVINYEAKRGDAGIALDEYKTTYVEVLKLIADKTNKHVALLSGEAIEDVIADNATILAEVVEDALEAIKTSLDLPINEDGTSAAWAVDVVGKKPLTPYGQHAALEGVDNGDYIFIGTAAVKLDKLVNANTAYVQDKVEVKLY